MGVRPVVAIGWDTGGWRGRKQGLASLVIDANQRPQLLHRPSCQSLEQWHDAHRFDRFVEVATGGRASRLSHRVVLAIDAPFGFPAAFTSLLKGTPTAVELDKGIIHNPYAFRETDRIIAERFKIPLSASFDKLGNNATVAMHFVDGWRSEGVRVIPFDEDDGTADVALEVYPAIVCDSELKRPLWLHGILDLAEALVRGSDMQDALVCAALALAYHFDGSYYLPKMVGPGPDRKLPDGEGWIFTPEGLVWSQQPNAIQRAP